MKKSLTYWSALCAVRVASFPILGSHSSSKSEFVTTLSSRHSQRGRILSTVAVLFIACAAAYPGIAICVALTISGFGLHGGPRAVASAVVYGLAAYAAPTIIGVHLFRRRGWGLLRASQRFRCSRPSATVRDSHCYRACRRCACEGLSQEDPSTRG
jgi:hypothetical protein